MYYWGMVLTMILCVLGELIWLPDPLRFGIGYFWMDALNLLVYLLALIPLLWMIASIRTLLRVRPAAIDFRWTRIRNWAVCIAGIAAILCILIAPKQLTLSLGAFGLTWLLVFVEVYFSERLRRKLPFRSLTAFVLTICFLCFLFWPTRYMVTYPGLSMNMNRYAQVSGGNVHGEISGVLVFERPAFPVDWVYAKLFPHYTFERENLGMSLGAYNQLVQTMKEDANASGSAIAFQKVGKGKGIISEGVLVTAIAKGSPVEGIMQLGDVIVEVEGHPLITLQELTARMAVINPGDRVEVSVLRGNQRVMLATATRANPDDPKRAVFGIQASNKLQYDIPEIVRYHNYLLHEGGPSHGAILALTLIDQLTPCGVTYGNHVAGTGTIGADGLVGTIGGAEQKAYTVSRTDADVFFVPVDNEADARKGAPGLQVVPVHSLDDMINWLRAHPKQGNSPSCTKESH
ncbi:PDZ domain-containing protein [Paenibacillus sp. SYP-B3998]|uniref:PDZ domain-containing protein n=1 Tax=Paenibacillus sp. SYP-B3998 TaxID=2678564 RepID=A0A6G3ZSW5_9BACL|nr:PDZ domain-containing protein [Paenibacillus sp. SYP-B3998]NEW04794.1 PDZ domain-containing protein [Paenibacillus sp. SYP-B3998]